MPSELACKEAGLIESLLRKQETIYRMTIEIDEYLRIIKDKTGIHIPQPMEQKKTGDSNGETLYQVSENLLILRDKLSEVKDYVIYLSNTL